MVSIWITFVLVFVGIVVGVIAGFVIRDEIGWRHAIRIKELHSMRII
jgi:hypothetical protein